MSMERKTEALQASDTNLLIEVGTSYMADYSGEKFYSLTTQRDRWKYTFSHWNTYHRSAWSVESHPTWGATRIPAHNVLSVTNTIYTHDFTENFEFFFDLGLAYSDSVTRVTSSHLLFKENLGFRYKDVFLTLTHSSNAGLKGVNTGEDGLKIGYRVSW